MQQITLSSPALTMGSREIAELTGKDHKNVLADVRAMLESLKIDSADFSAQYKDPTGRTLPAFNLPKRETLILVSGYSVALRAKIIDRWQELETATRLAIPQSLPEALRLAADLADQRNVAQAALAIAAPKAEALDRLANADGSMCVTDAAKALQMQPKRLFYWLQEHQWIYRRAGGANWIAYQPRIQAGLLTHKVTTVTRSDGTEKVVEQVLVTAKGLTALSASINPIAA